MLRWADAQRFGQLWTRIIPLCLPHLWADLPRGAYTDVRNAHRLNPGTSNTRKADSDVTSFSSIDNNNNLQALQQPGQDAVPGIAAMQEPAIVAETRKLNHPWKANLLPFLRAVHSFLRQVSSNFVHRLNPLLTCFPPFGVLNDLGFEYSHRVTGF